MADDSGIAGQSVDSTTYDLSGGSSSGLTGGQIGGAATLGLGALGFGAMLGQGESPLPGQFSTVTNQQVPWLQGAGQWAMNEGQQYAGAGAQALQMAQQGTLTPEQQAALQLQRGSLQNQAAQTFASMGRNISQDTSGISVQADIDAKMIAASQAMIDSTIKLGLGEVQAGSTFTGQGISAENAATSALIEAGNAQLKQDEAYHSALSGAFAAIGQIAGPALKMMMA